MVISISFTQVTAHATAGAIDVVAELTATRIQIPGYPRSVLVAKGVFLILVIYADNSSGPRRLCSWQF